jgi:hypothetical protein
MVLGRDKMSQIGRNYLLAWYLQLFEQCLAMADSQLLVIGYGFADPHVNQIIADSVVKYGLTIWVIDPMPADKQVDRIRSAPSGQEILDGIRAFHIVALKDLFPASQERTAERNTIETNFFGRRVG